MLQEGATAIPGHTDVPGPSAPPLPGNCQGVVDIFSRVGDKWTVLIIMLLAERPRRFNELRRMIGGVSQRMLTLTLRGLERDGLVARTVSATVPPRVDYALTALGHSLQEPVATLGAWAFAHLDAVRQAQWDYDQRPAELGGRG